MYQPPRDPQQPGWPRQQVPYPGPPPRRPPWPARHKVLTAVISVTGFLTVMGILGAAAGASHKAGNAAAPATAPMAPQATASSPAPSPKPSARTVATFTGSGQQNTPKFTVTATWKLKYSFNCAAFGGSGNFQVYEDGGNDFSLSVNDLASAKRSSTYAYDDAGTHYLEINSECSWSVKVIDEPGQ